MNRLFSKMKIKTIDATYLLKYHKRDFASIFKWINDRQKDVAPVKVSESVQVLRFIAELPVSFPPILNLNLGRKTDP